MHFTFFFPLSAKSQPFWSYCDHSVIVIGKIIDEEVREEGMERLYSNTFREK